MLDHDDELLPGALLEVVKALNEDRSARRHLHRPRRPSSLAAMHCLHVLQTGLVARDVPRSHVRGAPTGSPSVARQRDRGFRSQPSTTCRTSSSCCAWPRRPSASPTFPRSSITGVGSPAAWRLGADEKSDIEMRQAAAVNAHLARCGDRGDRPAQPAPPSSPADIAEASPSRYPLDHGDSPRCRGRSPCEGVLRTPPERHHLPRDGGHRHRRPSVRLRLQTSAGIVGRDPSRRLAKAEQSLCRAGLARAQGELVVSMAGDLVVQTPIGWSTCCSDAVCPAWGASRRWSCPPTGGSQARDSILGGKDVSLTRHARLAGRRGRVCRLVVVLRTR